MSECYDDFWLHHDMENMAYILVQQKKFITNL